jgi:hypothetical protein
LKQRPSRSAFLKVTALAAAASALALAAFGPALATGAGADASAGVATVLIKGSKTEPLRFVGPKTVVAGETLKVINRTNPKQVGPHTFALIEESLTPKTKPDRKRCFTPGHICRSIADWLGVKGEGPVTINPGKAGKPGWDTEGNLHKKGDVWFAGKPGASFAQKVTVDTSSGPTTIHFVCAVHAWMHGSIEVLPAG